MWALSYPFHETYFTTEWYALDSSHYCSFFETFLYPVCGPFHDSYVGTNYRSHMPTVMSAVV